MFNKIIDSVSLLKAENALSEGQHRSTHPERRSGYEGWGWGGRCQKAVQNARGVVKHGVLPSLAIEESGPACVICTVVLWMVVCTKYIPRVPQCLSPCPRVGIGTPPLPLPQASLSYPRNQRRGGVRTRPGVRGWGVPILTIGEKA
jgi:hypothetical protein